MCPSSSTTETGQECSRRRCRAAATWSRSRRPPERHRADRYTPLCVPKRAATMAVGPVNQMRQPRLAEMVSGVLRQRILTGAMGGDAELPTVDRLADEFGVSPPSIREALRILENEGLVTVRRGRSGGAVVHRPKPEGAAYLLGL